MNIIYRAALEPELQDASELLCELLKLDRNQPICTPGQWRRLDYHERARIIGSWLVFHAQLTSAEMQRPIVCTHSFSTIGD